MYALYTKKILITCDAIYDNILYSYLQTIHNSWSQVAVKQNSCQILQIKLTIIYMVSNNNKNDDSNNNGINNVWLELEIRNMHYILYIIYTMQWIHIFKYNIALPKMLNSNPFQIDICV